jgi:hypothetical protein
LSPGRRWGNRPRLFPLQVSETRGIVRWSCHSLIALVGNSLSTTNQLRPHLACAGGVSRTIISHIVVEYVRLKSLASWKMAVRPTDEWSVLAQFLRDLRLRHMGRNVTEKQPRSMLGSQQYSEVTARKTYNVWVWTPRKRRKDRKHWNSGSTETEHCKRIRRMR